jgi:hypothetical protein
MIKKRPSVAMAALFVILCINLFAMPVYASQVDASAASTAGSPDVPDEVAPIREGAPSGENTVISDDLLTMDWMSLFPQSVTGERFDGGGTIVDYVITGNKHFYTIVSREGQTFYLILDYDKEENNVYFLTEVTQDALDYVKAEQARESGGQISVTVTEKPVTEKPPVVQETTPQTTVEENSQKEGGKFPTMLVLILVTFFGIVGFGYYYKIYKPKKSKKMPKKLLTMTEEEPVDDEDSELDDELEYEDEP